MQIGSHGIRGMSRQLRRSGVVRSRPTNPPIPNHPQRMPLPPEINAVIARFQNMHLNARRPADPVTAPAAFRPPLPPPPPPPPPSSPAAFRHPLPPPPAAPSSPAASEPPLPPAAKDGKREKADEKKREKGGGGGDVSRGSLTVGGEVVGGFDDFAAGTVVLTLPTRLLEPRGEEKDCGVLPPHILLKNWRVLWEMVPLWRFFKPSHPELSSVFGLETGAGGDCLFHAISAAYNHLFKSLIFHMEMIRELAAQQLETLTEAEVVEFIIDWVGHYSEEFKRIPHEERVKRLQKSIRTNGNEYWGETGTLRQLLLRSPPFVDHKIGFVVLNIRTKPVKFRPITDNEKFNYERMYPKRKAPKEVPIRWEPRVETTIIRLPDTKYLMFLHCLENSHWILVGYAPDADKCQTETPIGSTFPIDAYPKPLFPFIREPT